MLIYPCLLYDLRYTKVYKCYAHVFVENGTFNWQPMTTVKYNYQAVLNGMIHKLNSQTLVFCGGVICYHIHDTVTLYWCSNAKHIWVWYLYIYMLVFVICFDIGNVFGDRIWKAQLLAKYYKKQTKLKYMLSYNGHCISDFHTAK